MVYANATAQAQRGVRTEHADYISHTLKWQRCRDVISGSDAVKKKGETYLSKLSNQENLQYQAYLKRTNFYNATARTISGLIGMLYRKPPTSDNPAGIDDILKDVDMNGTPIDMFTQFICNEVLQVYRVGILVDHAPFPDVDEGQPITVQQAQALNLRPVLKSYCTENIINWKFANVKNTWTPIQIVLKELFTRPATNVSGQESEFEQESEDRYRVLDIDNGIYRMRVFRINETGADELVEEVVPLMNNKPLTSIPFIMINADGVGWTVENPPLLDLVDVNLSHYRTSADYEHGCHFCGVPTFYIAGYQAPVDDGSGKGESKILLGGETAIILPDASGKAGFAEFTGQGLKSLTDNLDRKEAQMAILGARMLATEGKSQQSTTTTAIHRTGENSVLAQISISVSLGVSKVLTLFSAWANYAQECVYQINRDFLPVTIDGPTLTAVMASWQAAGMSDEEFFDYQQRADLIEADVDFEAHKKMTFQDPKALLPPPAVKPASGSPDIKANPEKP